MPTPAKITTARKTTAAAKKAPAPPVFDQETEPVPVALAAPDPVPVVLEAPSALPAPVVNVTAAPAPEPAAPIKPGHLTTEFWLALAAIAAAVLLCALDKIDGDAAMAAVAAASAGYGLSRGLAKR